MTRGILVQDMGKLWERKEVVECSYTLLRVVQLILSVPEVKLVGSLNCNKFVTSCIVVEALQDERGPTGDVDPFLETA